MDALKREFRGLAVAVFYSCTVLHEMEHGGEQRPACNLTHTYLEAKKYALCNMPDQAERWYKLWRCISAG